MAEWSVSPTSTRLLLSVNEGRDWPQAAAFVLASKYNSASKSNVIREERSIGLISRPPSRPW